MFVSPAHLFWFVAFVSSVGPAKGEHDLVDSDHSASSFLPDDFLFGSLSKGNKPDESAQYHRIVQDSVDILETPEDDEMPEDYIFVLYDDSTSKLLDREELEDIIAVFGSNGTEIMYEYSHVIQGFAVSKVSLELLAKISAILGEKIDYVTPDMAIALHATDTVDPKKREFEVHEHPTNWGLDRMDRFDMKSLSPANASPFDGKYHYSFSGFGVEVYVLDTGIRSSHIDLAGPPPTNTRVRCGFDAFAVNGTNTSCEDKVGHGTFMAGAIGGTFYGVAKDVTINSVKVFNDVGHGTVASAIAGLDYVVKQKKVTPGVAQVANLSFGIRRDHVTAFEDALEATLKAGVTIVTSSGNHGGFDCEVLGVLPSKFPGVISVAASTYKDESAQYNDLGRCIDLFAPGDRITGIWVRDDADSVTISGSSIASAHVAGAAALILEAFPFFTPEHVRLALLDTSEVGAITDIPSYAKARNNLLNTGTLTFVPEYDGLVQFNSG